VALVPVRSAEPDVVNVLAVTRDTWSLRLSVQVDAAGGAVNNVLVALQERNLVGSHKQVAALLLWEQDTIQVGPRYLDPRLFRTRLALAEELLFAINHDTGELEGTVHTFELALPLYSLSSDWGFSLSETHNILVDRLFIGNELRTWDDPTTAAIEAVPFEVDTTELDVRAVALRGLGSAPRHELAFGYGLSINRFELAVADVPPDVAARFEAANLPRNETASFLLGRHRFYSAQYATVANFQTFGFAEDLLVGHDTRAEVRLGPEVLGSDRNFVSWSAAAAYTALLPTGREAAARMDAAILRGSVEVGARLEIDDGEWIDRYLRGSARLASPRWGPLRLHLGGTVAIKQQRATTGLVQLGGSNGLRGFPSGAFLGESYALGHFEVRTLAVQLLTLRFGLVAFFDAGAIWTEGDEARELLSDVGLGLRVVVPQAQRMVYRFDYALATSGPRDPWPGIFTIGVEQVF
jgi:hypothetical protein